MAMPAAHLLCCKRGEDLPTRIEEVLSLAARIAKLRRPALASGKPKPTLAAADTMNDCYRLTQLIDVAIPDRIAAEKKSRDASACAKP